MNLPEHEVKRLTFSYLKTMHALAEISRARALAALEAVHAQSDPTKSLARRDRVEAIEHLIVDLLHLAKQEKQPFGPLIGKAQSLFLEESKHAYEAA